MPAKTSRIFILMAVPLAALTLGASAGGGGRGTTRGGAPSSLRSAMEDMQTMVLSLQKNGTAPEKIEENLKTLAQFERDVAIAKMQRPPVDRVRDPEKALNDFRQAMTTLQRNALDLEDAIVSKKVDEIKRLIATFDQIEKAGHDEFL